MVWTVNSTVHKVELRADSKGSRQRVGELHLKFSGIELDLSSLTSASNGESHRCSCIWNKMFLFLCLKNCICFWVFISRRNLKCLKYLSCWNLYWPVLTPVQLISQCVSRVWEILEWIIVSWWLQFVCCADWFRMLECYVPMCFATCQTVELYCST